MRPGYARTGGRPDEGHAHIVSNQRETDPPVLACPCTPESTITVLSPCEDAKCWRCGAQACPGCLENYEAWKAQKVRERS